MLRCDLGFYSFFPTPLALSLVSFLRRSIASSCSEISAVTVFYGILFRCFWRLLDFNEVHCFVGGSPSFPVIPVLRERRALFLDRTSVRGGDLRRSVFGKPPAWWIIFDPSSVIGVAMVSNGVDARLPQLDDPDSPDAEVVGGKKKRGGRAPGGEKGGKGLRHFSMKVCEKVESKGRTTYNEVADELVAEFTNPDSPHVSPDQGANSVGLRAGQQQYDEKNIRRRVYDALNVLMAMNIIFKDKKDIQWKGLPSASLDDGADLKAEGMQIRGSIERKAAYLHELQSQMIGLRNLVSRNERLSQGNNSLPNGGVALPFILVQTRPQATVEVEISEDMQVVHFDFNSTPFELHDDAYVLKAMSLQEQQGGDGPEVLGHTDIDEGLGNFDDDSPTLSSIFQRSNYPAHPSSPYYASMPNAGKNSSWPPVPSILKARVKHENIS